MKRLALLAVIAGSLVGCGGSGSASVALRPTDPASLGTYLQVSGSPAATASVASELLDGSNGGLSRVPGVQGKQDCFQAIPIATYPVTTPRLRKLNGQKVTLAVYGTSEAARAACQSLPTEFPDGIPVVGDNRRVDRVPSSSMEPTLDCARPAPGCLGRGTDLTVTRKTGAAGLARYDIVLFRTPLSAASACGEGGTFVKRVIGLPGETVKEDAKGFISVRSAGSSAWRKLAEPYISGRVHELDARHYPNRQWTVPAGEYFTLGDSRNASCDSRAWGSVPAANIIGPVVDIIRRGKVEKPAGIPG